MHFANIRHSTTPHIYHLLKRPLKFYLINETKKDGMKRSASAKQQVETTTDRNELFTVVCQIWKYNFT